jgi:hypothetical protein
MGLDREASDHDVVDMVAVESTQDRRGIKRDLAAGHESAAADSGASRPSEPPEARARCPACANRPAIRFQLIACAKRSAGGRARSD